ncbi:DUF4276 family protein [Silicimonas algicola]|uniref:Uncharacterized protein DUF4276 n=1 Tax=Silicimonas algicola TaxID=1826607 RepID=A0A316G5K4_9RHOB|nr:DUF4276 family protein [Silicimonas algicola]AZQ69132.1 DUF4276 family protein [Silicimonas algicola]PWK55060.1 uncharacterized protein DUF4276 [Silicimonas algicola]
MGKIFLIVEGHGEERALPVLVRRILYERLGIFDFLVEAPYRMARSRIALFGEELSKAVRLGRGKVLDGAGRGGIIILLDADDDCPKDLQDKFQIYIEEIGIDVPVAFVAANREYEAWFICCAEDLRHHKLILNNAQNHQNAETVRDAKGHFERHVMVPEASYSETIEQEKFSAIINLDNVGVACRSFQKLCKEIERLAV